MFVSLVQYEKDGRDYNSHLRAEHVRFDSWCKNLISRLFPRYAPNECSHHSTRTETHDGANVYWSLRLNMLPLASGNFCTILYLAYTSFVYSDLCRSGFKIFTDKIFDFHEIRCFPVAVGYIASSLTLRHLNPDLIPHEVQTGSGFIPRHIQLQIITNEMQLLWIILFLVSSTCFGRRFCLSSGALNCI